MTENTTNPLFQILPEDMRAKLIKPNHYDLGPYRTWGQNAQDTRFVFEIDARPLATLIDAAAVGYRVYELMAINRPGDIAHYLWLQIVSADGDVTKRFKDHLERDAIFHRIDESSLSNLPFYDFDKVFFYPPTDDEEPFNCMWWFFRKDASWNAFLTSILVIVKEVQEMLSKQEDELLQNELALIHSQTHQYDYLPNISRQCLLSNDPKISAPSTMPAEILELVGTLIKQEDVNSVYHYLEDYTFWRMVVAEQVRRAKKLNLPPQQAFYLHGRDSGIDTIGDWAKSWGGEVFHPYEGGVILDLFIMPSWFNFFPPKKDPNCFRFGYYKVPAQYVLSHRDFGEVEGATRTLYGSWVLYKSKFPYCPVHSNDYTKGMIEKWEAKIKAKKDAAIDAVVSRAANLIAQADGLLITAGAGMGVDSGLPDFRGKEGFWKAYPALAKANLSFSGVANPETFVNNPKLAWGFYGHRLNLYRNTKPHQGFKYLRAIAKHLDHGAFVFTSNVDGQFQKAGFSHNKVIECHGSIHHLQCQEGCDQQIWDATNFKPEVDEENCLLNSSFPHCPTCGGIARPNILMFGDWYWLDRRTQLQMAQFHEWRYLLKNLVILEIGAGKSIPTVREFGEELEVPIIRLNPFDAEVFRPDDVSLKMGALEGITAIAKKLVEMGFVKNKD